MRVGELRAALDGVPDGALVVMPGYEGEGLRAVDVARRERVFRAGHASDEYDLEIERHNYEGYMGPSYDAILVDWKD